MNSDCCVLPSAYSAHAGVLDQIHVALSVSHWRHFLHHTNFPGCSHPVGSGLLLHPEILPGGLEVSPLCVSLAERRLNKLHSKFFLFPGRKLLFIYTSLFCKEDCQVHGTWLFFCPLVGAKLRVLESVIQFISVFQGPSGSR